MTWLICIYHAATGDLSPSSLCAGKMVDDTNGAFAHIWRKSNARGLDYTSILVSST